MNVADSEEISQALVLRGLETAPTMDDKEKLPYTTHVTLMGQTVNSYRWQEPANYGNSPRFFYFADLLKDVDSILMGWSHLRGQTHKKSGPKFCNPC